MRPIRPQISPESFELVKYIGLPYEEFNCWELCVKFYNEIFDVELKHYCEGPQGREDAEKLKNLIYTNKGEFSKTDSPRFGDIILFRVFGVESHIGIFITDRIFLHTRRTTGSVLDNLTLWSKRVVGYYQVSEGDVC